MLGGVGAGEGDLPGYPISTSPLRFYSQIPVDKSTARRIPPRSHPSEGPSGAITSCHLSLESLLPADTPSSAEPTASTHALGVRTSWDHQRSLQPSRARRAPLPPSTSPSSHRLDKIPFSPIGDFHPSGIHRS